MRRVTSRVCAAAAATAVLAVIGTAPALARDGVGGGGGGGGGGTAPSSAPCAQINGFKAQLVNHQGQNNATQLSVDESDSIKNCSTADGGFDVTYTLTETAFNGVPIYGVNGSPVVQCTRDSGGFLAAGQSLSESDSCVGNYDTTYLADIRVTQEFTGALLAEQQISIPASPAP